MRRIVLLTVAGLVAIGAATAQAQQRFANGPCTEASKSHFASGDGHDHRDALQHGSLCGMKLAAYLPLTAELAEREDAFLGEIDVRNDLLVAAIAAPEAGFLLFDVRDPAHPRFLSWYRSGFCEHIVIDVDCGAYASFTEDGRYVLLAQQNFFFVPHVGQLRTTQPALPGVEVIDVSQPTAPRRVTGKVIGAATDAPGSLGGGVHTVRSHVIPEGPDNGPRAPGEYVFSIDLTAGVQIDRLVRQGDGAALETVGEIALDEMHDTFIQEDPLTQRTLLYVASGFLTGFVVYDVTDPSQPRRLGEWDITPECGEDYYNHTIDVTTVRGRRLVTMPAENVTGGFQNEEDQSKGCGVALGNGDKPGPLWIVDATDFSKLGQEGDGPDEIKDKSARTLIATWTNAAGAPAGNSLFTGHNQTIVGNKIYLSSYHAGVFVLDARQAFLGNNVRPRELAAGVPSASEQRPYPRADRPLILPYMTNYFDKARNMFWDAVPHRGHVLAVDMAGGVYSLVETKPKKRKSRRARGGKGKRRR